MRVDHFDYRLPSERIARHPTEARDGARLLVVQPDHLRHEWVSALPDLVSDGSLVVVNDTRVRKARLFGTRQPGGGKVELFMLGPAAKASGRRWQALGRANKPLRPGTRVEVAGVEIEILAAGANGVLEVLLKHESEVEELLERAGQVPIPPYLERDAEPEDVDRYQTVYADVRGSAAAPTAGLHFTEELVQRLSVKNRRFAKLTLEVGLGTFRAVTVDDLDHHPMHAERYFVSSELAEEVRATRARGAKVVAIGTSVVRALESAADPDRPGEVIPMRAETKLLIQPGYQFRVVDALFTNFHQPRSTLLALVSAFAGHDRILRAYREAMERNYRFLSYGDAMWIPECAAAGDRLGSKRTYR